MAKHRRSRSSTPAAPKPPAAAEPLPLLLTDVYLLTAESDGQEALGGLTVVIDADGLTVITPHRTIAAQLTWSQLAGLRTAGRTHAPDGREALVLEASGPARTHRFVVPADHLEALESTIAEVTGAPVHKHPRKALKARKARKGK